MRRSVFRQGFTLVELMVVIGIIATLMVLLLPAVNSALESGRRTKCVANQTKHALAMAMHDGRNTFLPGWRNTVVVAGGSPANVPTQITWLHAILPFLERTDVYDAFINGSMYTAPFAKTSLVPWLDFVRCPSNKNSWLGTEWYAHWSSYSANAAGASECRTFGPASLFNRNDGAIGDNTNGILMSLADITNGDGLATTLLIGETIGSLNPFWVVSNKTIVSSTTPGAQTLPPSLGTGTSTYCNVTGMTLWPDETNNHSCALGFPVVGSSPGFSSLTATTPIINPPRVGAFALRTGLVPSSAHPGGAVVAFADGSTRFLGNNLLPGVFAHLLTSRSVWNSSGPANQKYSTNSVRANQFLLLSGTASPYTLQTQDY